MTISRDHTSDLNTPIQIQWVYNWWHRDWADLSKQPNTCVNIDRAQQQYVGGPTFQIGSLTLPANQESVPLDLVRASSLNSFYEALMLRPSQVFPTTEKSGPYYFTVYNCDFDFDIRVKGDMYFRNPYGWLNGEDWPTAAVRCSHLLVDRTNSCRAALWSLHDHLHPLQPHLLRLPLAQPRVRPSFPGDDLCIARHHVGLPRYRIHYLYEHQQARSDLYGRPRRRVGAHSTLIYASITDAPRSSLLPAARPSSA